jgi:hypothetical protein
MDVFLSPNYTCCASFLLVALLADALGPVGKDWWNNSGGFEEHDLAEIRCQSIKERINRSSKKQKLMMRVGLAWFVRQLFTRKRLTYNPRRFPYQESMLRFTLTWRLIDISRACKYLAIHKP